MPTHPFLIVDDDPVQRRLLEAMIRPGSATIRWSRPSPPMRG